MSTASEAIGARLRGLREEPRDRHGRAKYSREKWAMMLRRADAHPDELPAPKSLAKQIAQWERGDHIPGPVYRPLYAKVTGKTEADLFGGSTDGRHIARRDALILAAAAGVALPRRPSGPVAPELVDYFRAQLAAHYGADMMLGPRALIETVTAQTRLIASLLEAADTPIRRKLAEVGTAYGAFLGWLHLDAGDATGAARWHGVALQLAHRAQNREAIACTLVDMAMAATDQEAGRAVIDLCDGALEDTKRLCPEVQVFALQQKAHGASLIADRATVDASLDTAAVLVGKVDVERWGTACLRTPAYVEVQRATCYGRLGALHEADELWRQIIPAAPSTARRDVGVWLARHATIQARARKPDQALELARQAVGMAAGTGSARAQHELAALRGAMAPWQDAPVGRDLAEVLAPATLGT